MPYNKTTNVFTRVWKFVDQFTASENATRTDFDTAIDDVVSGLNDALGRIVPADKFPQFAEENAGLFLRFGPDGLYFEAVEVFPIEQTQDVNTLVTSGLYHNADVAATGASDTGAGKTFLFAEADSANKTLLEIDPAGRTVRAKMMANSQWSAWQNLLTSSQLAFAVTVEDHTHLAAGQELQGSALRGAGFAAQGGDMTLDETNGTVFTGTWACLANIGNQSGTDTAGKLAGLFVKVSA